MAETNLIIIKIKNKSLILNLEIFTGNVLYENNTLKATDNKKIRGLRN